MAIRGRKPKPARGRDVPVPPDALPRCPGHLSAVARKEWRRLAKRLQDMGVLTVVDRAAFAAYCQAYARWVEAEEQLARTPSLLKTPSGYVQQSPWLSVANKQLAIMGRYIAELGLTPSSRTQLSVPENAVGDDMIIFKVVYEDAVGTRRDRDGNIVEQAGTTITIPPGAETL